MQFSAVFLCVAAASFSGAMGDLCTPFNTPFSWSDALSWPLNNGSSSETALTGADPKPPLLTSAAMVQDYIARKHNCLRTQVSPTASNMLQMQWSQAAADKAQSWANTCPTGHDTSAARAIPGKILEGSKDRRFVMD